MARSWRALLLCGLCTTVVPAHAAAVLSGPITLQTSQQAVLSSSTVNGDYMLPTSGTLTVTLTDQLFPAALSSLDFSLYSVGTGGATKLLDTMTATGTTPNHGLTESFSVASGHVSTLFVAVTSGTDVGLYTSQLTFTPTGSTVPLPQGAVLLVSGLIALGFVTRTRSTRRAPAIA